MLVVRLSMEWTITISFNIEESINIPPPPTLTAFVAGTWVFYKFVSLNYLDGPLLYDESFKNDAIFSLCEKSYHCLVLILRLAVGPTKWRRGGILWAPESPIFNGSHIRFSEVPVSSFPLDQLFLTMELVRWTEDDLMEWSGDSGRPNSFLCCFSAVEPSINQVLIVMIESSDVNQNPRDIWGN